MRLLTAALLMVLLAACGEAPSGSISTDAPTAEASTTPPPTAERTDDNGDSGQGAPPVNEALMTVRPNPATPGAPLKLTFPRESVRGVAFSLYEQRGDAWRLAYDLHSDGGQGGSYEPQWYGAGESPGHDDIGISGPGPDRVPVPDVAAPGDYLVCTANAGADFCAPLTISPRSSQTAEPPGAEAFTGTWYGPNGEVVSENGPGFRASASSGPAHCGWQSALILSVIWPPGSDNGPDRGADWRQYVRDPRGVLPMGDPEDNPQPRGRLDTDAKLPAGAEDSGFHTETVELWFGPDRGGEWAYLVTPDATERWPRADPTIGCD
jgi:hypothetical protein